MDNPNIIKLESTNRENILAISSLHEKLLPESKVSQFGSFFLRKFYYKILIEKNLIDAYLYKLDDKFVGFIVTTDYPFTFMRIGINHSFLYLSFIMAVALIINPFRLKLLFDMHKESFSDNIKSELGKDTGQFMSFGVLEECRKIKDKKADLTISNVLMQKVFQHFSERNKQNFFLMVLKTNTNAIKFYKKYNGITLPESIGESSIVKFEIEKKL